MARPNAPFEPPRFMPGNAAKRYTAALLGPSAALALSAFAPPELPLAVPLLLIAVVLSAWYGGRGPALLAGVVAGVGLVALAANAPGVAAAGVLPYLQGASLLGAGAVVGVLSESLGVARGRADGAMALAGESASALELERRRTETILQSVSDGIAVQDAFGRFVFVNDAAAGTLGLSSGEPLVSQLAADALAKLDPRDEMDREIPPRELPGARALSGEAAPEQLISYRASDSGLRRWALVRSRAVRDESGRVVLAVSAVHDLTERIRHEHVLEANARDLHQLTARLEVTIEQLRVERASAVSARADAEDALEGAVTLQRATAALSEARTPEQVADVVLERGLDALGARSGVLLAFGPGEAVEVVRTVAVSPDQVKSVVQLSPSEIVRLRNAMRRDDLAWSDGAPSPDAPAWSSGLERVLDSDHLVTIPLSTREGPLGAMVFGVLGDPAVTPRDRDVLLALGRQCAQALERARLFVAERQSRDDAEQANRAKSQFLAVMSHELRTPLNAILGYEELLETEVSGPISSVQKQHLSRIRESTKNLLSLIEQILSLSRVQSGKEDVRLEEIDASVLVREVASAVEPQLLRKGVSLELELPPEGSLGLSTDPRKVRQILFNVLSNAVKFTEHGTVRVSLSRSDGQLLYRVEDTGRGIEERDREHIFEPFVQLWGEGAPPAGTGLGLPVARELARHLGGDVTLESRLGEGSAFTIRLPTDANVELPPSPEAHALPSVER